MNQPATPTPITEDDIAQYLLNSPDFFERQAQVLANVQLTSRYGHRAVSLQERQAEMLRDKIRLLEHRLMDMIRYGNENMLTTDRLLNWAQHLLHVGVAAQMPFLLVQDLRDRFSVPQVALKLWDVAPAFADLACAQGASEEVKAFASSLAAPYCGVNADFEAAQWLDQPEQAASLAMLALRQSDQMPAFGLLVLASPDTQRFATDMGTDFLERIANIAAAALSRLRSLSFE